MIISTLLWMVGCDSDNEIAPVLVDVPSGKGHDLLSDYHFFEGDLDNLTPNTAAGVLPYDLNTPFFSDYAQKKRFIYVPEGQQIKYQEDRVLELPVGSVLIKHFYYNEINFIETRLLIRQENEWLPETYIWDEDGKEARRSVLGETRSLSVSIAGETQVFNYLIPNQNQCKNCHAFEGVSQPIGPAVSNLNRSYEYEEGTQNQLEKWIETGILEAHPLDESPSYPDFEQGNGSLDSRARAYLAVNCASCHQRDGSAANSGLYLEYDNQDSLSIGFNKTPVAAGDGSGGFRYVIDPGNANESILLYRMNSGDIETRMPEIGRELIHEEGVALIRQWIDAMETD